MKHRRNVTVHGGEQPCVRSTSYSVHVQCTNGGCLAELRLADGKELVGMGDTVEEAVDALQAGLRK